MTEEKYRDGAEWRLYIGAVSAAAFLMVTALTGAFFIYSRSLAVLYMGLAAISIAVGWGCLILTGLRRHLDQFMTATGELMDAVMASGILCMKTQPALHRSKWDTSCGILQIWRRTHCYPAWEQDPAPV